MKNKNLILSRARLLAVQTLASFHYGNNSSIEQVISDMENYYIKEEYSEEEKENYKDFVAIDFYKELVLGTQDNIEYCDLIITENLKEGHNFESIPDVLKEILRCAVYELKFKPETPAKVIINEYVDITSEFFDKNKITFANGIIDTMAKKIKS